MVIEEIAKIGVDNSRTEFCIARKLATGHASVLNDDPKIEYLFNPSFIEQRTGEPPDLKYCIYTESEGYVLNDVLSLDKDKQINPILHFGDEELVIGLEGMRLLEDASVGAAWVQPKGAEARQNGYAERLIRTIDYDDALR